MNVPGLSGTWQQRNAQLYKLLGSPLGTYTGSYDQNIYLLNKLRAQNYYKGGLPGSKPKATTTKATATTVKTATPVAQQVVSSLPKPIDQPSFSQVLPFEKGWERIVPGARAAAISQINPEAMRQYNIAYQSYMNNLASMGGGRFGGAGMGGLGSLQAESERQRQASIQDWLNQYQQGYKQLFYDPSQQAWDRALTLGQAPNTSLTKSPTWDKLYSKYQSQFGGTTEKSPFV